MGRNSHKMSDEEQARYEEWKKYDFNAQESVWAYVGCPEELHPLLKMLGIVITQKNRLAIMDRVPRPSDFAIYMPYAKDPKYSAVMDIEEGWPNTVEHWQAILAALGQFRYDEEQK